MRQMNTPKVTMIIISYNEKEYLPRAIDSCKMQSYENKEIIIGDDGSNDGSIELIKSYQAQGIRYFVMDRFEERTKIIPSIRVSNVIKRAIDITDGAYYVILSGDDYFVSDKMLSKAINFLQTHPKHSAYVYGFQNVSDKSVLSTEIPKKRSPYVYWSAGYIHVSCFVFRKISTKELLPRFCDDTGLEFVLATKGKWKYDPEIAFSYCQRDASIMHRADETELAIIETMLFQDALNWQGAKSLYAKAATYSRYYKTYKKLWRNKNLGNDRYSKYLENSSHFSNNLFMELQNGYNGKRFLLTFLSFYCLRIFRKLNL